VTASRVRLPERLPDGGGKGQALRDVVATLLASLPPGAALPSERELADRYGLARMTVRNELERLTAEGLVYRVQGRGTFVAEPRVAQAVAFSSFTEDMLARGHAPGSLVRSTGVVVAEASVAGALELGPGDAVFRLDRLRTADGRPMAVERAFLPLRRFPGIEAVDFAHASLFTVLSERFGVSLREGEQRIVAVAADAEEAEALNVAEGAPCLRFETVGRDRDDVPCYFARSVHRGDRYEVRLRQTRAA
jgi:DNA-binding GntR family transcriptional regulator